MCGKDHDKPESFHAYCRKKKQLEAEERANMSDWELKLIRVIPLLDACQSRRNSISSDAYLLGDEVDLKFHFGMNASVGWSVRISCT